MKKFLGLLFLAPLVLGACTPATSTTSGDAMSSSAAMMEGSSSAAMMESSSAMMKSSEAAMTTSSAAEARVINLAVDNFSFTPSTISVKKGEKVTLHVTGANGIHGFAAPDLGLNVRVEPGQSVDVVLDTSTAGTFSFFCNIPCGPGHKEMKGSIVIS